MRQPGGSTMIVDFIAMIVGIAGAVLYVGFFAVKVPSLPLTCIVVFVLALMIYSFYTDVWPSNGTPRPSRDV
jgi:hypothetical protein